LWGQKRIGVSLNRGIKIESAKTKKSRKSNRKTKERTWIAQGHTPKDIKSLCDKMSLREFWDL